MGGPARIDGTSHSETDNFGLCSFVVDGTTFQSTEQCFQYKKCITEEDREKILRSGFGGDVWCAGNSVELRSDWEEVKVEVMLNANWHKFQQNSDLASKLMDSTGRVEFFASSR